MTEDLVKQIKKNKRMIEHHIDSGGDAHPPVNNKLAGFMTPDQKLMLETAASDAKNGRGQRIGMPAGTDVLTLADGNYEIAGALNNPIGPTDKSFIEYDISTSFDGRRQIEACLSSVGRRYYRSIHSGGSPTSGTKGWWFDPFTVWNGSVTSGTISFTPMVEKYVGIRVRLRTLTSQSLIIEMMGTENSTSITIPNVPDDQSELQHQLYEMSLTLKDNKVTVTRNGTLVVWQNSMSYSSQAAIMVTEIKVLSEKG